MKNILVTGSNGFIGRHVCSLLSKEGYKVSAVIMHGTKNIYTTTDNISTMAISSIEPDTDWTNMLDGIDTILHLAARVHVLKENSFEMMKEYRKINNESTINLAENAAKMGVQRLIFLSTVKVYGSTSQKKPFIETDPTNPKDPYALSKLEAEQKLFEITNQSDLEIVVIRSPLVYGPCVKANFLRLMKYINKGFPWPFGKLSNKRSFVFVNNLADAILTCCIHNKAVNQIFLVSDGQDMSTPELFRSLSVALGKHNRMFSFNDDFIFKLFTYFDKTEQANRLFGSLSVDISKICQMLDWNPPYTVEEGLKDTAEWFKKTYI